ncbi:deoxyguanosinetriphosphate triphosphohydrolase [candidate division WOR-3 bacterium]|nr:deoxyguanosinetriphosphate triphosphohydrolase [candidate division WOR-3 bacterium]
MRTREEFEKLEAKILAPYAMKSVNAKGRKYSEKAALYRTCYQRDRDRIIHCTAFRRLEYKTQVFVNHEGDYYRTRLTHTIEVNQIARTIARVLGLNEDLADAISLAHDIGHPPFGHAGGEELALLMKGHGGFEHNRQGLRVVDELEERYPGFKGLNLTFEAREGIIKHTTSYDIPNLDGLSEFLPPSSPTLEAQVINVADEIAYNAHDLDDGLKAGYITLNQLNGITIWNKIWAETKKKLINENESLQIRNAIRKLINCQTIDVITYTTEKLRDLDIKSVADVRSKPLIVKFSSHQTKLQSELRDFLYNNLYFHYKVVKQRDKAKRYIKDLFNTYISDLKQLPPDFVARLKYTNKYRVVCDYISGMTDRFAQDEYERLFTPYTKM